MVALRTENLTKRMARPRPSMGVSVGVATRAVTALTGPNGTGKSTLVKAVLGLVRPDSGSIWLGLALWLAAALLYDGLVLVLAFVFRD